MAKTLKSFCKPENSVPVLSIHDVGRSAEVIGLGSSRARCFLPVLDVLQEVPSKFRV
ncbi:MAG: hypothetical protein ACLPJH_18335 [Myxococcaceae bacterium]